MELGQWIDANEPEEDTYRKGRVRSLMVRAFAAGRDGEKAKTCATCKYWTGEPQVNPVRRKCQRIDQDGVNDARETGEYTDLPAILEAAEHSHADLLTLPTFGCNQWKGKT